MSHYRGRKFTITTTVPVIALAVCCRTQATAASRPSSLIATTHSPIVVGLRIDEQRAVRAITLPRASCSITKWGIPDLHADPDGEPAFTVSASATAETEQTQVVRCIAGNSVDVVPMSLYQRAGIATSVAMQHPTTAVTNDAILAASKRLGINIVTATDDELIARNLAKRPNEPRSLQAWLRAVTSPVSELVTSGTATTHCNYRKHARHPPQTSVGHPQEYCTHG